MSKQEKQPKPAEQFSNEQIQTPPPPQVMDPSMLPGQGAYETYKKGETEKKKTGKPR